MLIREDLLQLLKRRAGKRGMSSTLNRILEEALRGDTKSLLGSVKRFPLADLRDHEERT